MADIKYYDVIKRPVITEKSIAAMGEKNILSLFIRKQTKLRSKAAVENVRWNKS